MHVGRAWPSGSFTDVHLFVSGVLVDDLEESQLMFRLKFVRFLRTRSSYLGLKQQVGVQVCLKLRCAGL